MKKLNLKASQRILTTEFAKVKGGDTPINPNLIVPPLDNPDAGAHIIDLG